MRRHLEAAQLHETQPDGGAVGGIELVDADLGLVGVVGHIGQHVSAQPVDQPRRRFGAAARRGDLDQGDPKLVWRIMPGLVDAGRLGGRTDEEAGEEIGQRRVLLPEQNERFQEVGSAHEGAVIQSFGTGDDVIAAPRSGVAAVDQELVGAEPALPRLFIDRLRCSDALVPAVGGVNVDFDHAGIGGGADDVEARIVRRGVAFDMNVQTHLFSPRLGRRQEVEIASTGGMKTQSLPSRGSTEMAVGTAPPKGASSCSTTPWRADCDARDETGWACSGVASGQPALTPGAGQFGTARLDRPGGHGEGRLAKRSVMV